MFKIKMSAVRAYEANTRMRLFGKPHVRTEFNIGVIPLGDAVPKNPHKSEKFSLISISKAVHMSFRFPSEKLTVLAIGHNETRGRE